MKALLSTYDVDGSIKDAVIFFKAANAKLSNDIYNYIFFFFFFAPTWKYNNHCLGFWAWRLYVAIYTLLD